MDFIKRKPTRLRGFDYSSPNYYFLTLCTKDKQCILGDVSVGDGVLDVPQVQLLAYGNIVKNRIEEINYAYEHITVDKYVIMPNHIHLIVAVVGQNGPSGTPAPTNAVIPSFVSTLKRYVNRETGHNIFQRSFHDHVIRCEDDYRRIWEYIDTNPAKWTSDCFYIDERTDTL